MKNAKQLSNQIKKWLKENNFNHSMVKVSGEIIIIDNTELNDAATIASMATGLKFDYMTMSMTKLSA